MITLESRSQYLEKHKLGQGLVIQAFSLLKLFENLDIFVMSQ